MDAGDVDAVQQVDRRVRATATCAASRAASHDAVLGAQSTARGSPEEGVYHGRERIGRLLRADPRGRGSTCAPRPTDDRRGRGRACSSSTGRAAAASTAASADAIVEPYEQRLEIRDGLIGEGRMIDREDALAVSSRERRGRAPVRRRVQPPGPRCRHRRRSTRTSSCTNGRRRPGAQTYHGVDGRPPGIRRRGSRRGSGCSSRSRTSARSATASCSRSISARRAGQRDRGRDPVVQRLHVPRRKGDARSSSSPSASPRSRRPG